MNIVDFLLLGFMLLYVLLSYRLGFVRLALELVTLLLSILIALALYRPATGGFQTAFHLNRSVGQAVAFIVLWGLLEAGFTLILRFFIYKLIPERINKASFNRIAGVIPATIKALIIATFFVSAVANLPVLSSDARNVFTNSVIASYLAGRTASATQAIFGGAIADTLDLLTVEPGSDQVIHLGYTYTGGKEDLVAEQQMLELVNDERTSRGIKPVLLDPQLQVVALAHSRDMFARGYFAHFTPEGKSPFDRMRAAHIDFITAGENLALAPNVEVAHQGLMNSPGHRANILDKDFGHIGIGIIDGGWRGEMFTQDFTN
jgi:uncharacterized protein YkwD